VSNLLQIKIEVGSRIKHINQEEQSEDAKLKEENKRLQSKVEKNEKTLQMLMQEHAEHDEASKVILPRVCRSMFS